MKKLETRDSLSAPGLLRIQFSQEVSFKTLLILHSRGLTEDVPEELGSIIQTAGGERISAVYDVSEEEIISDRYRFAREFKLYLRQGTDEGSAIETLRRSHLIESVRVTTLKGY